MTQTNKKKLWFKVKLVFGENETEQAYGISSLLFPDTALQEIRLNDGRTQIELYLSERIDAKILSDAIKGTNIEGVIEEYLYDPSQETEWKKYFKPQKIGKKIVVKPSWEHYKEKNNDIVVIIDPGAAFGTGLHETTRGSIILLEQVLELEKHKKEALKLLDAGTGSGILAMSAYKLGVKNIHAIDNDADAIVISKDNFKLNGINKDTILAETVALEDIRTKQKYGIILANIIPQVLIDNKKVLSSILISPGHLILSGILSKHEESVLKAFTKEDDFSLVKRIHIGEWVSLWLRKAL
jgi:ribosomal protein L11 methyltransferase